MARLVFVSVMLYAAVALRVTSPSNASAPTQHEVDAERTKLDHMSMMLEGLLKGQTLANSKIAPAVQLFAHNIESVLSRSKSMAPAEAMHQLLVAKSGIADLVGQMTRHQESLMKEDVDQREDVLLGVLMTHKGDAMEKQFDILKSDDFSGLDVSKALLTTHNVKTALYMQAAEFLDSHKNASGRLVKLTKEQKASRIESMAAALDKRVAALEHQSEVRRLEHEKRMKELAERVKKGDKHAKARIHHEEREFKKSAAMTHSDIESMKGAAEAIRKGDMKALEKAQNAIKKSLEALKNKNGAMLVFLQQGNAMFDRDCPFCVAQCVGKCHDSGKPYTSCLTSCADAGK